MSDIFKLYPTHFSRVANTGLCTLPAIYLKKAFWCHSLSRFTHMRKRTLNFFEELEKQQLSTTIRMNCWSANRTAGLKTISSLYFVYAVG